MPQGAHFRPKNIKKSMINFSEILYAFYIDFGSQKSSETQAKISKKCMKKS